MKTQIRKSVFETNSSSVHSLTMCTKDEWDRWMNGEVLYCPHLDKFLNKDDAETYNNKYIETHEVDFSDPYNINWGDMYLTFEQFEDDFCDYVDTFKGEKDGIVAFGYYVTDY